MRVVVLASYNITYVITPERLAIPGETVRISKIRKEHGGKGSNQAIALSRLGAAVSIIASVGGDIYGKEAVIKWKEEGLDCRNVRTSNMETGSAYVFVLNGGENLIYVNAGANSEINKSFLHQTLDNASADFFLSNFEISPNIAIEGSKIMKDRSKVIINPSPATTYAPETFSGIYALIPNQTEMKILAGFAPNSNVDVFDLARKYSKYISIMALTLGDGGSFIIAGKREALIPAFPAKARESTGAGDQWCSAFAFFLGQGREPFEAARLANKAAAQFIQRPKGDSLVDNLQFIDDIR